MPDCKEHRKMFDKAISGELSPEEFEKLNSHFDNCENCAKEYEALENTLSFMMNRERPEEAGDFLDGLWAKIEPELKAKTKSGFNFNKLWLNFLESVNIFFNHKYQLAAGMAILIIGIFIGKYFVTPSAQPVQETESIETAHVENVALQARADRYIDRSKVLLLGLMNFDPAEDVEAINLPRQKKISDELILEAADLKNQLNKPSQKQLKELVADLEVILLQIANLETEYDLSGIELVKNGVDRRGIFLKINIRKMMEDKIEAGQSAGNQKSFERKKI